MPWLAVGAFSSAFGICVVLVSGGVFIHLGEIAIGIAHIAGGLIMGGTDINNIFHLYLNRFNFLYFSKFLYSIVSLLLACCVQLFSRTSGKNQQAVQTIGH